MMGSKKILFPFFLISIFQFAGAREMTDTLESSKKDRVIVTYDIMQNNGQITIKFLDAKKKIGSTYRDKYKKLDEIAVLFFDRTGNYEDNMVFSGISTDAFMIPKEVSYKVSRDGYFLLGDNPTLSMELKSGEESELKIPLFFAHYEGKHRYKVFSRCEDLKIKLSKRKQAGGRQSSPTGVQEEATEQQTTQTITSEEELDATDADDLVACSLINRINGLLEEQEEYPFSDELKQAISSLREISYGPVESSLSSRIGEVLSACKAKEKELKAEADAAAARIAEQQKLAEEQAQARQDSIAVAAQQQAKEDRKQNLWLIIGGVILAVLAFVANQTLQHFRNVKNQKNMMAMQQDALKRAQDEAKRRTANMTQSQVNRVQGEVKAQTNKAINNSIQKISNKGKGKKGFSI